MSEVAPVLDAAGKSAGMVADYGVMVMLSTLFLAAGVAALWLVVRHFNRKLSGEYVRHDEVLAYLAKTNPSALRPKVEDLPDLRNHRFFTEVTRQMRMAEQTVETAERDLAVWTLRAIRDAFTDLVVDAYEDKSGFDAHFGDAARFRHRIDETILTVQSAVRYRLVDEFGFPAAVYSAWQAHCEPHEDLMVQMLDLAAERKTPYDRVLAVLDSQYARILTLRRNLTAFMAKVADVAYTPPGESSHSTMQAIHAQKGAYPAALFERRRG